MSSGKFDECRKTATDLIQNYMFNKDKQSRSACEILLVAFVREKVEIESDLANELLMWQEACEDADRDLIQYFNEFTADHKPTLLTNLGYKFADSHDDSRKGASVFTSSTG